MKKIIFVSMILIAGCQRDENDRPAYGESGLPKNCRSYVQFAIDEYRARKYNADDTFTGLERNCGLAGHLWGNNK
ncbi:kynureninase [Herbaspirillum sp. CAH-3]|nr:kynureninase [Herbaspirillum sp. CAH-3]